MIPDSGDSSVIPGAIDMFGIVADPSDKISGYS